MPKRLQRCKECNGSLSDDPGSAVRNGLCTKCFQSKPRNKKMQTKDRTFHSTYDKYFLVLFSLLFILPVYDFLVTQELPWAYFQFLRIAACIGFGYLSIRCMSAKKEDESLVWFFIFFGFAILYNPFFQVSLGSRDAWSGANFLSATTLLWYAFGPNLDDPKPTKKSTPPKKSGYLEEPRAKTNAADKRRSELITLITQPLGMQVMFITAKDDGLSYLGSDHAIGFVAGFTDAFLQRANTNSVVSDSDAVAIVTVVLDTVLEPAKVNPGRLFTLQDSGDPAFMEALKDGGNYAFKLLDDPRNRRLQMHWVTFVDEWIAKEKELITTTFKQSLLWEYQEFKSACTLLEYDEEIYRMAEELYSISSKWCSEFVENLDKNPKQNPASLFAELKEKIEAELNPFEDEDANLALVEAAEISAAAREEFIKVYELLGDRLKPADILEKVKSKYS